MKLACYANEKVGGVPHGLDNEVPLALIATYLNAGSPDDGTFTTTPYQLLKLIGLDTSGYYYQALKESLMRLTTATYVLSEAWRADGRWQSVTFRFIDKLEYTSSRDKRLDRSSVLRITLAKEIVRSLKNHYVKSIDIEFVASLRRPLSRALYRLLDAQRFSPEHPAPLTRFEVSLMEWAAAYKIVHKPPDKIRRTLEPAHQELIARRYLRSVVYRGRGQNQIVVYVFGEELGQPVDPVALELLIAEGLSFTSAYSLLPGPPVSPFPDPGTDPALPGHPGRGLPAEEQTRIPGGRDPERHRKVRPGPAGHLALLPGAPRGQGHRGGGGRGVEEPPQGGAGTEDPSSSAAHAPHPHQRGRVRGPLPPHDRGQDGPQGSDGQPYQGLHLRSYRGMAPKDAGTLCRMRYRKTWGVCRARSLLKFPFCVPDVTFSHSRPYRKTWGVGIGRLGEFSGPGCVLKGTRTPCGGFPLLINRRGLDSWKDNKITGRSWMRAGQVAARLSCNTAKAWRTFTRRTSAWAGASSASSRYRLALELDQAMHPDKTVRYLELVQGQG